MLTFEVRVVVVFQKRPGAEIDQFQSARFQVDDQVFIFHISMNNIDGCASDHGLDYL